MARTDAYQHPASSLKGETFGTQDLSGAIAVNASTPWLLDSYREAWEILKGRVDVFAVALDHPEQRHIRLTGRRLWLRSYEAGETLQGTQIDDHAEIVLLAQAVPDTLIKKIVAKTDIEKEPDLIALARENFSKQGLYEDSRIRHAREVDARMIAEVAAHFDATNRSEAIEKKQSPLIVAVKILAEIEGVRIDFPENISSDTSSDETVADLFTKVDLLCRTKGIRPRTIELEEQWWNNPGDSFLSTNDQGEILVVRPRSRRWSAMRFTGGSSYIAFNTVSGIESEVDEQFSNQLTGVAIVVQRVLPGSPQRLRDLLKLPGRAVIKEIVWSLLMGLAASVMALLVPLVLGRIVGMAVPYHSIEAVFGLVSVLLCASFGLFIFELVRNFTILRMTGELDRNLLPAIWDRILRLPATFFRQNQIGDLSSRIMSLDEARQMFGESIVVAALSATFALVNLIVVAFAAPSLAIIATIIMSLYGVFVYLLVRSAQRYRDHAANLAGASNAMSLQIVKGIAKIRVSGATATVFRRWTALLLDTNRSHELAAVRVAIIGLASASLALIASAAVYLFTLIFKQNIPISNFVVFASARGMTAAAVSTLAQMLADGSMAASMISRIQLMLDTPTEDSVPGAWISLEGDVTFSDLHFHYRADQPAVLNGLSLHIPKGSFTALVGASGCGKSTVLRCLLGFETPERGAILLDNKALQELDLSLVRRQFGVVLQNLTLVGGTFAECIIGGRDLTVNDAWDAAEQVGIAEFIRSHPEGMDFALNDSAATLSGGQLQRLMLARAIAGRPRILILDEATSALDNRSQDFVTQALSKVQATRIVVAHRLSTVRDADQIAVIDAGRVAELGTHDELMKKNGLYSELIRRQI